LANSPAVWQAAKLTNSRLKSPFQGFRDWRIIAELAGPFNSFPALLDLREILNAIQEKLSP
jgi:hypothetical protein